MERTFIFVFVIYFCVISHANAQTCSSGTQHQNHCLKFKQEPKTYTAAEADCQNEGGHLLSVYDSSYQSEATLIMQGQASPGTWLGSRQDYSEGLPKWVWIGDCDICTQDDTDDLSEQGCYNEYFSDRDLPNQVLSNDATLTNEQCKAACNVAGYDFAGMQVRSIDSNDWEDLCYCGASFGKYFETAGCTVRCKGNSEQFCGGYGKNLVFNVNGLYGRWEAGQPNNLDGFQFCGAMGAINLGLADEACYKSYRFICRLPNAECTTNTGSRYEFVDGVCHYLSLSSDRRTHAQSRQRCRNLGGELARLDNADRFNGAISWLQRLRVEEAGTNIFWNTTEHLSHIWLALQKYSWEWIDGTKQTYTNFEDAEPSSLSKNCLYIDTSSGYTWKTEDCGQTKQYICSIDVTTTTIAETTVPPTTTTESTTSTTTIPSTVSPTTITPTTSLTSTTEPTTTITPDTSTTTIPTTTTTASTSTSTTSTSSTSTAPTTSTSTTASTSTTQSGSNNNNNNNATDPPDNTATDPNTGAATGNEGGLDIVWIILIVLIVLLIIALIIMIIVFICYKKNYAVNTVSPGRQAMYDGRPIAHYPPKHRMSDAMDNNHTNYNWDSSENGSTYGLVGTHKTFFDNGVIPPKRTIKRQQPKYADSEDEVEVPDW